MFIMPYPYVDSAVITGDKITFRVEVTDFKTTEGGIEISGQATQVGGALAEISAIAQVPATPNGEGEDQGKYFVDVTADTIPPKRFRKDQDVTVFVRVSKVWVTVLGEHTTGPVADTTGQEANDGTTWDIPRQVIPVNGDAWPSTGGN
jgi:hypothetical protein